MNHLSSKEILQIETRFELLRLQMSVRIKKIIHRSSCQFKYVFTEYFQKSKYK